MSIHKVIRLRRGERVIAVVPESTSCDKWSNGLCVVHVLTFGNRVRQEWIKPQDRTKALTALCEEGAVMARALMAAVPTVNEPDIRWKAVMLEQMLHAGWEAACRQQMTNPPNRLTYLGRFIFGFWVYDDEIDEELGKRAVEACRAIQNSTTAEYSATREPRLWFSVMRRMPFFANRIAYSSARSNVVWWSGAGDYDASGLYHDGGYLDTITFTAETWREFVEAILHFADHEAGTGCTRQITKNK